MKQSNFSKKMLAWAIASVIASAYAADINYTYDALGRLTQTDYANGASIKHTYDNSGNILATNVTGVPTTDTDKDSMPDAWETYYGLDPNDPKDAVQDLDGDGVSNLQEYKDGTDPSDKASFLVHNPTGTTKLNDTGINTCANTAANGLTCPQASHPGQDAEFGRDVSNNNDTDGHVGFSFTKISSTGAKLSANATDWDCVKDNVTGLMWEVKTTTNMNLKYTNYGDKRIGDTSTYVTDINTSGLCGQKNWRLPTVEELQNIVDYSQPTPNPTFDTAWFPNTPGTAGGVYWSSSPLPNNATQAYGIYAGGILGAYIRSTTYFVRLVRNTQ